MSPVASGGPSTYGHQLDCAIIAVRLASKLCQVQPLTCTSWVCSMSMSFLD